MPGPLPSSKSRLRPVYRVPEDTVRPERVIYQLEDQGDPILRLRASVREVDDDGSLRFLYRVDAYSRMTGGRLGTAERVTAPGTMEEFAARAREFQTAPFQQVLAELSTELRFRYSDVEAGTPTRPAPDSKEPG
ncbi:MAG: hypothetical protein ABR573_06295 [Candidatus Dormibacteria bacterium]